MEDLEDVVEGHLFWQSVLKEKIVQEEDSCKFFILQNFANLEERETACDPCCGFGL